MNARRVLPGATWSRVPGITALDAAIYRFRGFLARRLSVRAKLTLWYGLMSGVTLALAGTAMYVYVDHQLTGQIDGELHATGVSLNQQLSRPLPLPLQLGKGTYAVKNPCSTNLPADVEDFCLKVQTILDQAAIIGDHPGEFEQIEFNANPLATQTLITPLGRPFIAPPDPLFLMRAVNGQVPYQTLHANGTVYRIYYQRLAVPPSLAATHGGLLEVLQNESAYQRVEHTVLITLLLGIPIGLLIALAAGLLIARAALRPIRRISRTVRSIGGSEDLSRRLNFVGVHDEVGELADTFDDMMARLEHVFETQRQFIADASHELRTPLTAIRGNADLMRIAPPEDREVCLASIRRESERMSRLVTDLLLLAEADSDRTRIQRLPVDLDELVVDVYHAGKVLADSRVEMILGDTDSAAIEGDADRLKQLLLNLTDNAIKFTPKGGSVALDLRVNAGEAVVSVSDSGIGISPSEQEAIFQRFYRVEKSRSQRGSGLGLSICAWIAREHGGRITVNSSPGKGSTFALHLPLRGAG